VWDRDHFFMLSMVILAGITEIFSPTMAMFAIMQGSSIFMGRITNRLQCPEILKLTYTDINFSLLSSCVYFCTMSYMNVDTLFLWSWGILIGYNYGECLNI
jgi:hypothetical protein